MAITAAISSALAPSGSMNGSVPSRNVVSLTRQGRQTFARAGRLHLDGTERHVGSRLTAVDTRELRRLLGKLIDDDSGAPGG